MKGGAHFRLEAEPESRVLWRLTCRGVDLSRKGDEGSRKDQWEKLSMISFSLGSRASRRFWSTRHHRVSPTLRRKKQSFVFCRKEEMVLWRPAAILHRGSQ